MKVVFAGGGTGGHLYPAIAISEQLKKHNINYYFMVSDRGIERNILRPLNCQFEEQKVSAYMNQSITGKIKAVFNMIKATGRALKVVQKGDKVILTGGFAAAPSAIAAILKGCDLYLHEQNSVMGLVNRIFAKFSKKVFLSFENTKNAKGRLVVTGNPVREVFYNKAPKKDYTGHLLILGGSQGSRKVNKLIASSIDEIMSLGFNVTHQCGAKLYDETKEMYGSKLEEYKDRLILKAYIENAVDEMGKADIIVSRSGAGAVFEIKALRCPAIYIPFAGASENHQYFNALEEKNKGCCIILEEDKADTAALKEALNEIKDNIAFYRANLEKSPVQKSSEIIFKELEII